MGDKPVVQEGRTVTLHFSARLEDGFEVESTAGGEPLTYEVGDGTLIGGLEVLIIGLQPGDRRTFVIGPEESFGFRDPANIHDMPRDQFEPDIDLTPGNIIEFTTPAGDELPGAVLEADDDRVTVDFNHPLAGHTLTFDVEVVAVE